MFGFENQGCSFSFPILGASEHFTFPKITWKPERVSRQTAVELQAVCMGFHLPLGGGKLGFRVWASGEQH